MNRRIGYFVGGSITLWVVLAVPARLLWGDVVAWYGAAALLLCLVPSTLTLLWTARAQRHSPDQQMIAVLGGTGVRMFFVLAGALALTQFVPFFQEQSGFWAWLLLFYLFTLAFEVVLLVTNRDAAQASDRLDAGRAPATTGTSPVARS